MIDSAMQSTSSINESWMLLRQPLDPNGTTNLGRAMQVQRAVSELLAQGGCRRTFAGYGLPACDR